MTAPATQLLPWDEASRLNALRALKLLDSPPEERFDRITRMAREVLQVPIALISLVDAQRQWFKSAQGTTVKETPRAVSFCAHAILQDDIFLIEDASRDARFCDNPLVTGAPHIRFYAGKPLYSIDGKKVGTLCLIDFTGRCLSSGQRDQLRDLAAWAEREINTVTESSQALVRLEHSLRLAHLLEHAAEGVLSIATDGTVETANPAACTLFGKSAPQLIGHPLSSLFAPGEPVQEHLARASQSISASHAELTGMRGNEPFPLEASFRLLDIAGRKIVTAIVRDISQRRQQERIKSEFISSVSHELRTPLTSILGALSMVREDAGVPLSPQDTAQLIEVAYQNCQRLNALVNDILDVEKLDAGMMRFHCEALPAAEVLEEACRLNRPFAQRLSVALVLDAPDGELRIAVDRMRFVQVLTNLISNACKFSPAGKTVTVKAQRHDDRLRISVADQGPGIADAFRNKIFQRFAQAQPARDNRQTGTGLGLSLARSMTEKMGGRIGYDSLPGHGATFFVDMPLA